MKQQLRFNLAYRIIIFGFVLCSAALTAQENNSNAQWRQPAAENLVYLDTTDGRVIIELNPSFAPQTVAQFKRLVKDKFYDGLRFYRVIDGFVAQGGDGSDLDRELSQSTLPAEFEREYSDELRFISVQKHDLFAAETGFIDGFASARDKTGKTVWLTHCPGVIAMARDNNPDSGSTDFYIVIGQAPRYLDRNLTIFGRVLTGMDIVQQIKRGSSDENGIIANSENQTQIVKAILASDLSKDQFQPIKVMNTNHSAFSELLDNRRHRTHEFFHHKPPAVLDICQVPVPTQLG